MIRLISKRENVGIVTSRAWRRGRSCLSILAVIGNRPKAKLGEIRHRFGVEIIFDPMPRVELWIIPAWKDEPSVVQEYRRTMEARP